AARQPGPPDPGAAAGPAARRLRRHQRRRHRPRRTRPAARRGAAAQRRHRHRGGQPAPRRPAPHRREAPRPPLPRAPRLLRRHRSQAGGAPQRPHRRPAGRGERQGRPVAAVRARGQERTPGAAPRRPAAGDRHGQRGIHPARHLAHRAGRRGPHRAAHTTDIRVRDLKKWIRERGEGKGLPDDIVDLLVLVYAVQSDRAWIRAGKRYTGAEIGRLDGDIVLRRQPLPSEEDFDAANRRARQLFGLEPQPVRNARAVQRLAEQLKERGSTWLAATETLLTQLQRRAVLLGVDEEAPRLRTAQATYELLGRLRALADDTELVTALARADLPGDAAVYKVSMETAGNVAAALDSARWETFDTLLDLVDGGGEHASEAAALLQTLRTAARHNEQEKKLATELDRVAGRAFELIRRSVTKKQDPVVHGSGPTGGGGVAPPVVHPDPVIGEVAAEASAVLTPGQDVAAAVTRLRGRLGIPDDADIEITVRVVRR